MMKEDKKPNNPPAFPTMEHGSDSTGCPAIFTYEGMTLRDYYAGEAITNLTVLIKPKTIYDILKLFLRNFGFENTVNYERQYDVESDAEYCYLLADAMLKARENV